MIAVSLDLEGRITYANPFLCELTGWSRTELLGRDWLEVFNGTEVQFLERMAQDDVLPYEENWIRTRDRRDPRHRLEQHRDSATATGASSERPASARTSPTRRRNERRMGFQLSLARALAGAERLEDVAEPMVEAMGTTFGSWACVYWKVEGKTLVAGGGVVGRRRGSRGLHRARPRQPAVR